MKEILSIKTKGYQRNNINNRLRNRETKNKEVMRLLTHNLLACLQCEHFPLDVTAPTTNSGVGYPEVKCTQVAFDENFTRRMLNRIDYDIFLHGVKAFRQGLRATLLASESVRDDGSSVGSSDSGDTTLNFSAMIVAKAGEIQLSVEDVLSFTLPETLEDLTAGISVSTTSPGTNKSAENSMDSFPFSTTDIEQQRLLLLLHTLLEGLALQNGALHCSACEASYTVEDFIPSFVT